MMLRVPWIKIKKIPALIKTSKSENPDIF